MQSVVEPPIRDDQQDACGACAGGVGQPFPFSMAFQPVVDVDAGRIVSYEALVRGIAEEPAGQILSRVTAMNRYAFDQSCRVTAIALASRLGLQRTGANLSINFIPGAMYRPENCVRATLVAARRHHFPVDRLTFELTENEEVTDTKKLGDIFRVYRENRFSTALDDFGAGFSGLSLLAEFMPDLVKIDMALIRGVDTDSRRQAIVGGIMGICRALATKVVAEGVETRAELSALRGLGISMFQGYLFARPAFERLPPVVF